MSTRMDEAVDVGTTKRLTLEVETFDPIPQPVDPEQLAVYIELPSGVVRKYSGHRDTLGRWYADFVVSEPGQWRYRWEAAGPIRAEEGSFLVRKSLFEGVVLNNGLSWTEFNALNYREWNRQSWTDFGAA